MSESQQEELKEKYSRLARFHYKFFPDWRISQLIVNYVDWVGEKSFYRFDNDEIFFSELDQFGESVCPACVIEYHVNARKIEEYEDLYNNLRLLHTTKYESPNIISFIKYILEKSARDIFYIPNTELLREIAEY